MHHGLMRLVTVQVHHHDQRLRLVGAGQLGRCVAGECEDVWVGGFQHRQVVVAERLRMLAADAV